MSDLSNHLAGDAEINIGLKYTPSQRSFSAYMIGNSTLYKFFHSTFVVFHNSNIKLNVDLYAEETKKEFKIFSLLVSTRHDFPTLFQILENSFSNMVAATFFRTNPYTH